MESDKEASNKLKNNNMNYKVWREDVNHIMKNRTPEQVERCQSWLAGIGLQGR